MGAILGDDPLKGAFAGGIGGLAEGIAEALPDDMNLQTRADLGKLGAGLAAFVTGQDINIAIHTATNAVENNFMRHEGKAKANEDDGTWDLESDEELEPQEHKFREEWRENMERVEDLDDDLADRYHRVGAGVADRMEAEGGIDHRGRERAVGKGFSHKRGHSPEGLRDTFVEQTKEGTRQQVNLMRKAQQKFEAQGVKKLTKAETVRMMGAYGLDAAGWAAETLDRATFGLLSKTAEAAEFAVNLAATDVRQKVRDLTGSQRLGQNVGEAIGVAAFFIGPKKFTAPGDTAKVATAARAFNALDLRVSAKPAVNWAFDPNIFTKKTTWTAPTGTQQTYKVFQRNDIDWDMVRTNGSKRFVGKTNIEAARAGFAPQLPDGSFATLHHVGQDARGPLAEASTRYHGIDKKPTHDVIHQLYGKNKPHPYHPVKHNGVWTKENREYWKARVLDGQ